MSIILSLGSFDPLGYWPATNCIGSDYCTRNRKMKVRTMFVKKRMFHIMLSYLYLKKLHFV